MKKAVILTALAVEYRAVRMHLNNCVEETHPKGTVYECGRFEDWKILIAEIGPGNQKAAVEAERATAHFSPSILMFIGVAGGIKDVQLGDVVAATKVYGYESGKAGISFHPRPDLGSSAYTLQQRARAESKKVDWRRRVQQNNGASKVFVAPIAAGEKVVSSRRSDVCRFLRQQYGDAVAVEMEGRGFLEAAAANEDVKAIIVRGISDLIDKKEEADKKMWQEFASQNASAFAFQLLSQIEDKSIAGFSTTNEIRTDAEDVEYSSSAIASPIERKKNESEEGSIQLKIERKVDYNIVDLGAAQGKDTFALAINNLGQIVGSMTSGTSSHAFVWQNGVLKDLGVASADHDWSLAQDINDECVVVGVSRRNGHGGTSQGFVWKGAGLEVLEMPKNLNAVQAQAINDRGTIAGGSIEPPPGRAIKWCGKNVTILRQHNVRDITSPTRLNSKDQIVGFTENQNGCRATLWDANGIFDLGLLSGDTRSSAEDINESGIVVGWSQLCDGAANRMRAFIWENGQIMELNEVQGATSWGARAINSAGDIVGWGQTGEFSPLNNYGILWKKGDALNLNELLDRQNWRISVAYDINDHGQIVGQGVSPDGAVRAILLNPIRAYAVR